MKINREDFTDEFIRLAIAQGETFDDTGAGKNTDEYLAIKKLNAKLASKLDKLVDFLADDPVFAKEMIDKLIASTNFYVIIATAGLLWEFNYCMKDCYRLFEKVISDKDEKHGLSVIAAKNFYLAIKEGRLKRRKEYPKLD